VQLRNYHKETAFACCLRGELFYLSLPIDNVFSFIYSFTIITQVMNYFNSYKRIFTLIQFFSLITRINNFA